MGKPELQHRKGAASNYKLKINQVWKKVCVVYRGAFGVPSIKTLKIANWFPIKKRFLKFYFI